jgi:hypothetical protein
VVAEHHSSPLLNVPLLPQILRVLLPLGLQDLASLTIFWWHARGSSGEVGVGSVNLASLTVFFLRWSPSLSAQAHGFGGPQPSSPSLLLPCNEVPQTPSSLPFMSQIHRHGLHPPPSASSPMTTWQAVRKSSQRREDG